MNNLYASHKQVVNKLLKSPHRCDYKARYRQNYYSGCRVLVYGVWCRFPTVVKIRLSQAPAGDWLAGSLAELGNFNIIGQFYSNNNLLECFRH